jgi:hypothetical protein
MPIERGQFPAMWPGNVTTQGSRLVFEGVTFREYYWDGLVALIEALEARGCKDIHYQFTCEYFK